MLPRELWPHQSECHDVLELVSKSVGATRLEVARTRPDTAAEILIEEPAVHEQIEGIVGSLDTDSVEGLVPGLADRLERGLRRVRRPVTHDQLAGGRRVVRLSQN